MNIFKKFKTTFNVNSNSKKSNKNNNEVQCLKYKICSEFTTEYVFDTNPRHFQPKLFTPSQSKKLQIRSLSENNLTTSKSKIEKLEKENTNKIWPSENDIRKTGETHKEQMENKLNTTTTTTEQEQKTPITKPKIEKGILKNRNDKIEQQNSKEKELYNKDNYSKTNFNEEITYEQFEPIDDQLGEEEIYYFEPKITENPDEYVVHRGPTVRFVESDHEYEEPIHAGERQEDESLEMPVYNLSTHPKLNPTAQIGKDDEYARSIGLNSFGNTQKLPYPGDYSLEASSIFFDSQNDYEC